MADHLICAIWEGPFIAHLVGRGELHPGDEAMVTEEDLLSTHWRRKEQPKLPKPKAEPTPDTGSAA